MMVVKMMVVMVMMVADNDGSDDGKHGGWQ
jgi:hypothetical protein